MKDSTVGAVSDRAGTPQPVTAVQQSCDPVTCRHCGIYNLCLPLGLERPDPTLLDNIVRRKAVFKRGHLFFRQGKRFDYIYAIRSGSVKSYLLTGDGRTQITAFHIAGDVLGLSGLAGREYTCEARALETTSVCMVDAAQFEELAKEIPSLQYHMLTIMSKQIRHDEELMLLLGKRSAEEKLAGYLLGLSRRYASRNYSPTEFRLSMSRGDIGNYLGIAEETVCRVLARFRQERLITTYRRHTRLNDIKRLSAMADATLGRGSNAPARASPTAPVPPAG
jgi:CRP/FNR family transcriptional regulator, anaerobic regulatory protein